jgi:hypothetical protein
MFYLYLFLNWTGRCEAIPGKSRGNCIARQESRWSGASMIKSLDLKM